MFDTQAVGKRKDGKDMKSMIMMKEDYHLKSGKEINNLPQSTSWGNMKPTYCLITINDNANVGSLLIKKQNDKTLLYYYRLSHIVHAH